MEIGCCGVINFQATAMAANIITMGENRQTPTKLADASKDATCMTCAGQLTLPKLDGVFVVSSSHLPTPMQIKAAPIWGDEFLLTRLFENQVKPN